jgi:hypothetical protein
MSLCMCPRVCVHGSVYVYVCVFMSVCVRVSVCLCLGVCPCVFCYLRFLRVTNPVIYGFYVLHIFVTYAFIPFVSP